MKRNLLSILVLFFIGNLCFAQGLEIKTSPMETSKTINNGIVEGVYANTVNSIHFKYLETPSKTYTVKVGTTAKGTFNSDGAFHAIDFQEDIRDKTIDIYEGDNIVNSFTISSIQKRMNDITIKMTANQFLGKLFPELKVTNFGVQILVESNRNTQYKGKDYVHVFFDQNGNSLLSTIPQGVSNLQYVVHVFYLTEKTNPITIDYSISQTKGKFDGTIIFNNTGSLDNIELRSKDISVEEKQYAWAHKEILLSTSTTDIQFEIQRNLMKSTTDLYDIEKTVLNSFTIPMSKVYHGTFEIGLINSTLSNPSYELVESPTNSDEKVVKKGSDSNRGYVTAMATFYTSPIIILEKIFGKDVPKYKLTGRNFLDDHKIYERIYPSVGISLNDKSFENLFVGLTWEFARGGSIWGGYHYGKINTFEKSDEFVFGETVINESEFKLKTDTDWEASFAFGVNLDIKLVTNLFK